MWSFGLNSEHGSRVHFSPEVSREARGFIQFSFGVGFGRLCPRGRHAQFGVDVCGERSVFSAVVSGKSGDGAEDGFVEIGNLKTGNSQIPAGNRFA